MYLKLQEVKKCTPPLNDEEQEYLKKLNKLVLDFASYKSIDKDFIVFANRLVEAFMSLTGRLEGTLEFRPDNHQGNDIPIERMVSRTPLDDEDE